MTTTTDRALQHVQRHDALRHRERTIVNHGEWDTVHRCDRALGRLARKAS